MQSPQVLLVLSVTLSLVTIGATDGGFCSAPSILDRETSSKPMYWKVTNPTLSPSHLQENARSALPPHDVERFIFVVQGSAMLTNASGVSSKLMVDSYTYLPPNFAHSLRAEGSATLVVFERSPLHFHPFLGLTLRYASLENHITEQIVGSTDKQPLLETPGEVFQLRKLLPQAVPFDFNIHQLDMDNSSGKRVRIMDFQPGEFLNVKEVHYNQHGLLLLEGQGIYRLGDSWYPVQAGDVLWMAPFVPQWYAALGKTRTRYLLYKDVNRNPL
ncbi:(S)-ureidoglycine aminohydrolase isoform X5 [Citrus clementina]|uniref:(S)-ureidoglycine aminohydrolase isoform X5 n=1 Tax=Citrus clementina TaxID=85681 RepID=UPI000CED5326|nr:(S)-ureidoglycine aminohydrolase isoform X5 [Citrus x clementina]